MFLSEDLDPEELKNKGNIKWENGEIEEANNIWRQALKECIKYSMRGFPTTKNVNMQINLRLNLSLYHLKKTEYSECINQCNIILEKLINLDETMVHYEGKESKHDENREDREDKEDRKASKDNEGDVSHEDKYIKKETLIKILLRNGNSHLYLQDFKKCKENINLIKRLDPENVEMIVLEKKMKIEELDYNKKQKELYMKMCNTS